MYKYLLPLIFKKNENTYSVMSVVVEVVTPTVKSVFEIAVWDNFGKFETESCFSVGLELFFALEGRLSIHFLTTGCIQDLSPLQDLVPTA